MISTTCRPHDMRNQDRSIEDQFFELNNESDVIVYSAAMAVPNV